MSRFKFNNIAKDNRPDILKEDIYGGDKSIAEYISDSMYKYENIEGEIFQVLPLTDKVLVSVKRTGGIDPLSMDSLKGQVFNAFFTGDEDIALLDTMIPLINFDQSMVQIDLNDLVGKKVRVKTLDSIFALEAELVSKLESEDIHPMQPPLKDLKTRVTYGFKSTDYYSSLGYDDYKMKDFLNLKIKDYTLKGVFRFNKEAYWDKDIPGLSKLDILIEDKESPLYIQGRNYLEMKDKLCHLPTIMFTGR